MTSHTIDLFFNGRKETLDILDTGGDIIKYLTRLNPICPLIGTEIKLEEQLGKGSFGTVFLIEFPEKGPGRYAVKRNDIKMFKGKFAIGKTYAEGLKSFREVNWTFNVDEDAFYEFNGIANPNEVVDASKADFYYPEFMTNTCKSGLTFPRADKDGKVTVLKGSLVCQSSITEFIISLLAGELVRDGSSINFVDTFYFATCRPAVNTTQQYTFMEKIDTSLKKLMGYGAGRTRVPPFFAQVPTDDEIVAIYIQTVHALAVLQNRLSIVHGDLHTDNVFIERTRPDMLWKGKKLADYDFLRLNIYGGFPLYIPVSEAKYIAKLGDWGLSVKYPSSESPKTIGKLEVFETGYTQSGNRAAGPWIPNFYSQSYDVAYFTARLHYDRPKLVFVRRVMMWILGYDPDRMPDQVTEDKLKSVFMEYTGYRPDIKNKVLTTALAHVSPKAILSNPDLMGRYLETPVGSTLTVSTDERKYDFRPEYVKRAQSPRKSSIKPSRRFSKERAAESAAKLTSKKQKLPAPKLRNVVVNWMVGISDKMDASYNAFIRSVAILDTYQSFGSTRPDDSSLTSTPQKESQDFAEEFYDSQSTACAAMYLAFENDEILVSDPYFRHVAGAGCDIDVVKRTRLDISKTFDNHEIEYTEIPTSADFFERWVIELAAAKLEYDYALYALYVAAAEYDMLKYPADIVAVAAIILGRIAAEVRDIFQDVVEGTGVDLDDAKVCLMELASFCSATTEQNINKTIYEKFSSVEFSEASTKILVETEEGM